MHIERIDFNPVLLELRFERTLGSDINGAKRLQNLHQSLCDFGINSLYPAIMMSIQRSEADDEIGFGGIDAVGFDNLRIGCKMIRMEVCQFVIQWKMSKMCIETLLDSPQKCVVNA